MIFKNEKNINLKLKNLQQKTVIVYKQKEDIIKKLNLSDNFIKEVNILAELCYLKDFRKNILYQAHYYIQYLLKEIAQRLNYSLNLVYYIFPWEMPLLLLGQLDKRDFKNLLKDRLKLSVIKISLKGIEVFAGRKANQILKKHDLKNERSEIKRVYKIVQLKGQVASSGFCQGRVKIINSKSDINKLKKREILVSVKTDPTLLSAMQRAGAIIAEMGGITSHAAIVARELQKPCIIGVKSATMILKDGDRVEVDANKGKVTII